jgi:hypothetical protein
MPEQKIMWTNKQGEWFNTYEEAVRSERNHERVRIKEELLEVICKPESATTLSICLIADYIMQNFERVE